MQIFVLPPPLNEYFNTLWKNMHIHGGGKSNPICLNLGAMGVGVMLEVDQVEYHYLCSKNQLFPNSITFPEPISSH